MPMNSRTKCSMSMIITCAGHKGDSKVIDFSSERLLLEPLHYIYKTYAIFCRYYLVVAYIYLIPFIKYY